jgi:GT2 family glycosyltransferase
MIRNPDHHNGDYFDSDFVSYKEDVDLAWRLRLLGYRSLTVGEAVAHHLRSFSGSEEKKASKIISSRNRTSRFSRYFSYRNHFLVLFANQYPSLLFRYSPFILAYELKKFFYILLFETANLKALGEVIAMSGRTRRKRKYIRVMAKAGPEEISRWVGK